MDKTLSSYLPYIDSLKNARVLVVGDLMIDKFINSEVSRISPEAPIPVALVKNETAYLGGAGNVARNVAALGGTIGVCGVVGNDKESEEILAELERYGIAPDGLIIDTERPTITKTRIVAGAQQIVRVDREESAPFSKELNRAILAYVEKAMKNYNALVISDYAKGMINEETARALIAIAKKQKAKILVDPSIRHFSYYKGAIVMTPNLKEAREGIHFAQRDNSMKTLTRLGETIRKKLSLPSLIITLGAEGMALFADEFAQHNPFMIPTRAKAVYDVSGAGDTVIATLAMALSTGFTFVDAAFVANAAAGVVVEKRGTATVTLEELKDALSL